MGLIEAVLSDNLLRELARPFALQAVKFKALTKAGGDGKCMAAFYIDARLVAERLNEVVHPANWSDEYELLAEGHHAPALYFPVECRLTVFAITKTDVGNYQRNQVDDIAWKAAYSDAFKRAAVKFRIGSYLYAIPKLRAKAKVVNEKTVGLEREGEEFMRTAYARWLASDLNRFGEALDHGDVGEEDLEAGVPSTGSGDV